MNKKVIILFVSWVIIINLFAVLAFNRFNLKGDTAYKWIDPSQFSQNQEWNLISLHVRWDSFFYLDIAQNGYSHKLGGELSNMVFFPLYPFLIKALSFFTGGNFVLSGWVLSLLFLFLSLLYLYKLVREFHPEVDKELALILLLIFPTAFFLNAIYSESLFLFLSIATFYYAFKKNFILAGVFGLLASLTKITGLLLFLPLIWEYFKNYKFKKILNLKFFSIFLVPLGTFAFFLFHYFKFKDFLLFFKVEGLWGRSFSLNGDHFSLFSRPATVNLFLDVLFLVFAIIATYFVFKKIRASYGIYMLATLVTILSTGTLMSIGRYILVLFPIYILLASVKNKQKLFPYVLTSVLLLAMNIALFVNSYWAG